MKKLLMKLFRRRSMRNTDIDEEIQAHLRMAIEDRIERGQSPEDARFGALREFGNVARVAETTRSVWNWTTVEQFFQDLRLGARILWKAPALTGTAVALIALVIGCNTTICSIVHSVLTNAAPGVEPDGLVALGVSVDGRTDDPANSYPNYVDYAAQTKTLKHLLARSAEGFTLQTSGGSYELWGSLTSANYFQVLGVKLAKGRAFSEDENRVASADLVAVISHRLWQTHFQGADDVIGRPITLNNHAATIIGVAASGFAGPEFNVLTDVWLPILSYSRVDGTEALLLDRSARILEMYGRLADGASLADVQVEFESISKRLQAAYPGVLSRFGGEAGSGQMAVVVAPYSAVAFSPITRIAARPFLAIFSVITLITLFIVSINIANLMLARAVIRQREMAVRQSFGASRLRILRVLIGEGLAISVAAWAAACLFAWAASRLLVSWIPPEGFASHLDFSPDWEVAAYAMILAIAATLVFMTAPAVRAWRQELLPWLKAGEAAIVQGRSRLSNTLIVAQLTFSIVLLTGAGLAYRSLSLIDRPDHLGFNKDNLVLITLNTEESVSTPEANAILLDRFRERLLAVPGVEAASYGRRPSGPMRPMTVSHSESEISVRTRYSHAGPDHLRVLGVKPVFGRDLSDEDRSRASKSAVISQSLARTLWPGRSALGQTIMMPLEFRTEERQSVEIVGVVADGFFPGASMASYSNFVFLSAQQVPEEPGDAVMYVRYSGDLGRLTPALGAALAEVDARVPITNIRTMEAQLENTMTPVRVITTLLTLFSFGSLTIAAVGQYAVMAFNMKRRRRDYGLRLALGASSRQILNSALREGLKLTAAGIVSGFVLSLAAGQLFARFLYGVTPTDMPTYLFAFVVLTGASLLACYLPARSASRIDPATSLRQE